MNSPLLEKSMNFATQIVLFYEEFSKSKKDTTIAKQLLRSATSVGANINEVEKAACKKTGSKHAVALSSGTAALHMAVKLAGIKQGDKVFCSDVTFSATVNPIVYEGAIPVFIDSERDTWNMDPVALEKAFAKYPDARVVLLVTRLITCRGKKVVMSTMMPATPRPA